MTNQASIFEVDRVLNIVQRRCQDLGVAVKFDPDAVTACTDGSTVTLPVPRYPVSQESIDVLYGMVIHECGHHLRPKAFDILRASQPPEHVQSLFNIIEDDGMERERALEWKGDRQALSQMNEIITKKLIKQWGEHFKEGVQPDQDMRPLAAMSLGQLSRLEWDTTNDPNVSTLIDTLPKEAKDLIVKLESDGWVRRYRDTETVMDTWNTTIDLVKELYPDNDPTEYEKIREAGLKGHDKGTAAPKRDTKKDTMADSQNKMGQPDSVGQPDDGSTISEGEGRTISWKDCVLSDHDSNSKGVGGNLGITWEGFPNKGGAALMPTNKIKPVDFSRTTGEPTRYLATDTNSRALANKIRRYIQSRARSVVVKEKYHGRLDGSSLIRLAMPPIDKGEWNKKIFYDQRKHTVKDTCIFVLVDWSGSMNGRKKQYAADAAQRLVHTFDRVLNIPVALAAFTNGNSQCDIGYIKKWHTRGMSPQEISSKFDAFSHWTAANNDADSVNWAYQQIQNKKESRKILIVLSDGAPAGSYMGHPDKALSLVTKSIEKAKKVELYGVGICSTAVKKYYSNYKVVNKPSQINEVLFNLLKEGVK